MRLHRFMARSDEDSRHGTTVRLEGVNAGRNGLVVE
jgi:hypothetical protein